MDMMGLSLLTAGTEHAKFQLVLRSPRHEPNLLVLFQQEMGDKFVALVGSGRQVCYILLNKLVALVGSGRQVVAHLMTKKD
jgi:hypothetical protein